MPTLWAAWKGVGDDTKIWNSENYNGPNISGVASPITGRNAPTDGPIYYETSSKPAILVLPRRRLVAFKDPSNSTIYYGADLQDGIGFRPPRPVPGVGTSWAPSLATSTLSFGDAVMAWNGVGGDTRIWLAKYTSALDIPGNNNSRPWSDQHLANTGVGPLKSGSAPAIVALDGSLLMVWRGEGDNDNLYWSISPDEGNNWIIGHSGGHAIYQQQVPGASSSIAPALTVFNGKAVLAWKGGRDTGIYTSIYTPGQSTPWQQVRGSAGPFGTSHGPSVATFGSEIVMGWKGSNDTSLWYATAQVGGPFLEFGNQSDVGNQGTSIGPVLAVLP